MFEQETEQLVLTTRQEEGVFLVSDGMFHPVHLQAGELEIPRAPEGQALSDPLLLAKERAELAVGRHGLPPLVIAAGLAKRVLDVSCQLRVDGDSVASSLGVGPVEVFAG